MLPEREDIMNTTKDFANLKYAEAIASAKTTKAVYLAIRDYVETLLHVEFYGYIGIQQTLNYRGSIIYLQMDNEGNIELSFDYDGKEVTIQFENVGGANFVHSGDRLPRYNKDAPFAEQRIRDVLGDALDYLRSECITIAK